MCPPQEPAEKEQEEMKLTAREKSRSLSLLDWEMTIFAHLCVLQYSAMGTLTLKSEEKHLV